MLGKILLGGAIGIIVGTLIGTAGKNAGGTCPILCHPTVAAVFFGAVGMLIAGGIAGKVKPIELAGFQSVETEEQLSIIMESEKPALVEFYTDWCGFCRKIAPMMSSLASEYKDKMVFVKVDGDKAREITRRNKVSGYPTTIIFSGGVEVDRIIGARAEEDFRRAIEKAIGQTGGGSE